MKKRTLGKTGLEVAEIGFGAWAISGRGYGPTKDGESTAALHLALDLGIDFIDTADSYGDGHSEELIGSVLEERGDTETVVATKFGWDFYGEGGMRGNMSRDYAFFAVEQSLKRLRRDAIDIYQIHNSNPHAIESDGVFETMEELKSRGYIRYWGISANYCGDGVEALKRVEPDTIQVPYSIFEQEPEEELFPMALERNVGIIVREPLASGLLTGKYGVNSTFHKRDHRRGWSREYLERGVKKYERVKFLDVPGRTMVQSAIRFSLSHPAVSVVIPGAKTTAQVEENTAASEVSLSAQELEELRGLYKEGFGV